MTKVPPIVRDLLVLIAGAVLTWATQDALPALGPWITAHPPLGPLVGALATQLLLIITPVVRDYGVGSGRHLRTADQGSGRPWLLAASAVALAAALIVLTSTASAATYRRRQITWIGVRSAAECHGDIVVHYGYERITRSGTWYAIGDSWGARIQIRYIGNGASPGGTWGDLSESQRSEGYLRASVAGRPTWDAARVVGIVDGHSVTSQPWLPIGGCTDE